MKTLGILGGMGSSASIRFYESLIHESRYQMKAEKNDQYPHLIISNLPVPDLIKDKKMMESAITMVQNEAVKLEKFGAEALVIACNTMHLFMEEFNKSVKIPFISIIDTVIENAVNDGRKCIGILGTKTLMQSGLYQDKLKNFGISSLTLPKNDQDKLSEIILKIIAGDIYHSDIEQLDSYVHKFKRLGADSVILGCTELPLVLKASHLPLYNSIDLLAKKACKWIYE